MAPHMQSCPGPLQQLFSHQPHWAEAIQAWMLPRIDQIKAKSAVLSHLSDRLHRDGSSLQQGLQ